MEDLTAVRASASRAMEALESIFTEKYSVIVRDAAIQRFEFTFEAVWKLVREHLAQREGIICTSPKGCFRDAFRVGLIDEEQTVTALEMVDDRNRTVHNYHEDVARAIWDRLPRYRDLMRLLVDRIREPVRSP